MTKQETIIDARKKLGLNQKEFGLLLYVERSTVSMWEKGKRNPNNLTIREALRLVEAKEKL